MFSALKLSNYRHVVCVFLAICETLAPWLAGKVRDAARRFLTGDQNHVALGSLAFRRIYDTLQVKFVKN